LAPCSVGRDVPAAERTIAYFLARVYHFARFSPNFSENPRSRVRERGIASPASEGFGDGRRVRDAGTRETGSSGLVGILDPISLSSLPERDRKRRRKGRRRRKRRRQR